ncbi:MAG: translation elongation factor Ts [Deltaproteobacteria bacterium]|nr:translation elongation factor Ts [Deltaproteobacteria bacterium]
MEISTNLVRELREKTGAGVMDCKKALAQASGDFDKAVHWLREKGVAQVAQRAGRAVREGLVASYIHPGSKIGVLIEVNCESDFVARTPEFQTLARELAMQVAAASPRCVRREEVAAAVVEQERQIYLAQAAGKPSAVVEQIVSGRLEKFFREVCLLEQGYIRDPARTVGELLGEFVGKLGERIEVRRFARFQLGEALDSAAPISA